jgi:hypothetical protein
LHPTAATRVFGARPLFRQGLEDIGRFIANDVFALGHWPDQAAKNWQAAESEIRRAVIDANLAVHLQERLGRRIIANAERSIGGARDYPDRIFLSHSFLVAWRPLKGAARLRGECDRPGLASFEDVRFDRRMHSSAASNSCRQ